MSPFVHPDTHVNIHVVYASFFHYQSDERQIFQVGSLRSEQLFGNEVRLVRWESLYNNHKVVGFNSNTAIYNVLLPNV